MSNTIAVVIAVIGLLALFAGAGALFAVVRKAGNRAVPAPQESAAAHSSVSPELAAESERLAAEAGRAAERRLEEARRAAEQIRSGAGADAGASVRRAEGSGHQITQAQRAPEGHAQATTQ